MPAEIQTSFGQTLDHITDGLDRLLEQYREQPGIEKLFRILLSRAQNIEDTLQEMYRQLDLEQASGVGLDRIGRKLELKRGSANGTLWDDELYRSLLRAQIYVNRSSGDFESIAKTSKALLAGGVEPFVGAVKIRPDYPKSVYMNSPDPLDRDAARSMLKSALSGGDAMTITFYDSDNYFGFAEDPNAKPFNVGVLGSTRAVESSDYESTT